jgi:hypothetical protein
MSLLPVRSHDMGKCPVGGDLANDNRDSGKRISRVGVVLTDVTLRPYREHERTGPRSIPC